MANGLAAIKQAEQDDKERAKQNLQSLALPSGGQAGWVSDLLELSTSLLTASSAGQRHDLTNANLVCCKQAGYAHAAWYNQQVRTLFDLMP